MTGGKRKMKTVSYYNYNFIIRCKGKVVKKDVRHKEKKSAERDEIQQVEMAKTKKKNTKWGKCRRIERMNGHERQRSNWKFIIIFLDDMKQKIR